MCVPGAIKNLSIYSSVIGKILTYETPWWLPGRVLDVGGKEKNWFFGVPLATLERNGTINLCSAPLYYNFIIRTQGLPTSLSNNWSLLVCFLYSSMKDSFTLTIFLRHLLLKN